MFKNIVVAVDGSEHSAHAIRTACDIAKHYGSAIHLVHTPQLDTVALAVGAGVYAKSPTNAEVQKAGKAVMEKAVAEAGKAGVKAPHTTIGNGAPADEVLARVKVTKADLIVAGRRGLGGIGSLLMGSTSLKLAHDAPCAVLTVK